jgi:acyl-CoA synthetase (AMP-forming)/AMP-acid ligase II
VNPAALAAAAATRTIPQALRSSVARRGRQVALAHPGGELTFEEVGRESSRLANALAGLGVGRGSAVGVLAENRVEYGLLLYACAKLGAMAATLNWRLSADELRDAIQVARPRVIVVSERHRELLAAARTGFDGPVVLLDGRPELGAELDLRSLLVEASSADPDVRVEPEDVVSLVYTSGTTGRPKAAMISQRAIVARATVMAADMGLHAEEAFVAWAPMFHMVSSDYLLIMGIVGGRCVIVPGFEPDRLVAVLHREPVAWLTLMPGALEPVLDEVTATGRRPLRLRLVGSMADLVPPELIAETTAVLNAPYFNSFGSTEAGTLPSSNTTIPIGVVPDRLSKRQSAFCDVRLVDESGQDVAPGEPGEMLLRAPTMFSGYLGDPAGTREAFASGWYHSGDVMRRNRDGTLDFLDRRRYLIKSGGENIYPAELERVLRSHGAVREAVVVRGRDPRWGEVPWACVAVREPAPSAEELIAYCGERLARYKRPRHVVFMEPDAFPRSETGKVLRQELERRLFGEAAGRDATWRS